MQCSLSLWLQLRKYDTTLIKSQLLTLTVNERRIEQIVIKKTNRFVSFRFANVPLLDFSKFSEELQVLTPSSEPAKLQRRKLVSHMKGSKS